MRAKIKAMNYGLAYGLSAFGLSSSSSIEPGEARGPDGRVLPDASAACATTSRGIVDEARAHAASPRRSSAAAATCPT